MTGLRFVAALLVFANHVGDVALPGGDDGVAAWLGVGRVGVSFFFILSGFVLTWSNAAAVGRGTYAWRRFARIAPSHVLTWSVALVATAVTGAAASSRGAVLSLPLLQAWFPSSSINFSANPVAWSLSCELFFYVAFPFVLPTLRRLGPAGRRMTIGALVALTMVFPFVASMTLSDPIASWAVYVLPLTRATEFVLGALLALEVAAGRVREVRRSSAVVLVGAAIALAAAVPPLYRPAAVTLVPMALLIVAYAQSDLAGRRAWVATPALVRLGEWSFAFYLVHRAGIGIVDRTVGLVERSLAAEILLAGLAFGVSVALAAVMYTAVERPAERWLRARGAPSAGRRLVAAWQTHPRLLAALALIVAAAGIGAVGTGGRAVATRPYLVPAAPGVSLDVLLTVDGARPLPDGYRFVGGGEGLSATGVGSEVVVYSDHDLSAGEGAVRRHGQTGAFVSRLVLDPTTMTVTSGSDLIGPGTGFWDYPSGSVVWESPRFADGTEQDIRFANFNSGLLTPPGVLLADRTGHGYGGSVYFANEENGDAARAFGITVEGTATMLPRLGLFSRENTSVAGNETDTTVVIGNEDSPHGQIWIYVGTKQVGGSPLERAGLTNGDLFVVAADDPALSSDRHIRAEVHERTVEVELASVDWNATGADQNATAAEVGLTFDSITDGRFHPDHPNDYYFLTESGGDTTPDGGSRRDGGGLWRLRFVDIERPQLGASLTLLLDGSESVGAGQPRLDGPDSMTIDRHGNLLMQEDPNDRDHVARVIAYRLEDGALGVVAEFDPRLFGPGASDDPDRLTTDEESSGIIDTESLLGPGTFLLNAQAHTAKALGSHGSELVQHGQLLTLRIDDFTAVYGADHPRASGP
ncbi:acyltransferase family protein [Desertimonas flava]|uniref:acyltransferase family protein n=1 Tax=Desertimonas flava TaxID=2064846 RepID=UPI0013C409CA|nr:acyltransferase family protein [Desertimonas flava]